MPLNIGFFGMGIMGQPMSKNIMKKGYDVTVYNRTREKCEPLIAEGAKVANSAAEAVKASDVLILMLTGPEAIDQMLTGPDGILSGDASGKTLINMSTVPPAYSCSLAEMLTAKSITFIDAPVSGSKKPAEEGTLVILASGPKYKVTELTPLLLSMGKKVVYCGEAGKGSSMKMAINLLLGIMMEGFSECVNLGQKCGLSTDTVLETVLAGPLGCGLFNLKAEMLKTGTYPAQFPFKHMTKDIRFVMQTADEQGAAVPIGNAVFQLYRQGMGKHLGDMDFAAVKQILEKMSD